jgi:hydroxymethylbilane synthase
VFIRGIFLCNWEYIFPEMSFQNILSKYFFKMLLKIGTRGSQLALWQAHFVEKQLQSKGIDTQIVIIETKGDKILDKPLAKIGSKGVFTEELEQKLYTNEIDLAVHSAKDMPSTLPEGLELIAFTKRELPNDVLVSYDKNVSLEIGKIDKTLRIGTSSTRRVAMLKHYYPHVEAVEVRGNLQTRFRKLKEGEADALLLAYAGVHRLGHEPEIVQMLDLQQFTPAVGQGSIAVEISNKMPETIKELLKNTLNDAETSVCLLAERAFLATLQGGCSIPVFALATLQNSQTDNPQLHIIGGIISLDGSELIRKEILGYTQNSEILGVSLANHLLEASGERILREIRNTNR